MKFDKSMIWRGIVLFAINTIIWAIYIIGVMFNPYTPIAYLVLALCFYFVLPLYPIVYGVISWFLTKSLLVPNVILFFCFGILPCIIHYSGSILYIPFGIVWTTVSLVTELIVRAITKASVPKKQTEEEQFGYSVLIDSKSEK